MKHAFLVAAAAFATVGLTGPACADERHYLQMRGGMSKLAPLTGTWDAIWRFYDKNGALTLARGVYTISFVLDGAYLEWKGEHERKGYVPKTYAFIIFTTFNSDANRYEQIYFYNDWPQRVFETGAFDDRRQEFRTSAFIPREDGIHDEHVRTVLSLKGPSQMVYTHYSRYSNESRERTNLVITLTRRGASPQS